MKKVTKTTVKKLIKDNGSIEISLIPCKANLNSIWISPIKVTISSLEELERTVNEYSYYNCNNEVGNYPHYYI